MNGNYNMPNMQQMPNMQSQNNDAKGITFAVIGILTIIVAIAGATFAYFQATVTNNAIKGNSGYVASPLTLTVAENTSIGTSAMVPQLDAAVKTAANSTNNCKDANENAVCKRYTITIKNNTTNTFYVEGIFTLTASTMPNLKWGICSAASTCTSTTYNPKSTTTLVSPVSIAGGVTNTYYIVIWISETGTVQTDSGAFSGVVTFTGYNTSSKTAVGITSTLRS